MYVLQIGPYTLWPTPRFVFLDPYQWMNIRMQRDNLNQRSQTPGSGATSGSGFGTTGP